MPRRIIQDLLRLVEGNIIFTQKHPARVPAARGHSVSHLRTNII